MSKLEKIYSDIKEVRIQGATNIAKAAVKAYLMVPSKANIIKLRRLRPTEPMLSNALALLEKGEKDKVLSHFDEAQEKINKNVISLIKNEQTIFTHCHSTNVIKALIYSKEKRKKFLVYNTETRPLYQGRQTAKELSQAGIMVTNFVDSGMHQAIKESDIVLIGCDAIVKNGIINKIGSAAIADIAWIYKKPVYVVADSWKYSPKNVKIEERDFHEVWKKHKNIKIRNPAFEKVDKKYIRGIVSELGILSFDKFIRKIKN